MAQQIRSDPLLSQVPIIFLTAIVSQKETNNEIGGFPFLAKPVSLSMRSRRASRSTTPGRRSDYFLSVSWS